VKTAYYQWAILGLTAFMAACSSVPEHQGCYVAEPYVNGTYTGSCDQQSRANGQGVATGVDTYKGEFKSGVIHGWGLYTWSNGATFCGQFSQGNMAGLGIYTDSNGNRQEGIWEGTNLVQAYQANRLSCTIR